MAKELILILGGARSGKSSHAQTLALEIGGPDVLYVATAEVRDEEMAERIAIHQAERPAGWHTLEAPRRAGQMIAELGSAEPGGNARAILVDCMTLLVSNAVLASGDDPSAAVAERAALEEVDMLLGTCRASNATWIVVSNEVGLGLVPPYPLGRAYRDALGRANQRLAAAADRVLLMVAGIPMKVK